MAFAQNLEKCFHILTQGQTYTEEELCIKLEDALLLCNKFSLVNREIVILHNPHQIPVEFTLTRDWNTEYPAGVKKQCTLADSLYVIYSPGQKVCRVFLMKNRRKPTAEFANRFYTGLCRLDLFSSRSLFSPEGREACDFLASAEVGSIANFGVFYRKDGCYDMRIFSGDLITPLQEFGVEPRRVVVYRGNFDQRRVSGPNWMEDYESQSSLRNFGRAVEEMMIGQPISREWKEGFVDCIRSLDGRRVPEDFVRMDIEEVPGAFGGDMNYDFVNSVGAVILINVDEE